LSLNNIGNLGRNKKISSIKSHILDFNKLKKGKGIHLRTKIRELRESRNMSQKELGALVGVSRQTINYIEMGKTSPKITVALKMAKIFNTPVEEIFELEEEEA